MGEGDECVEEAVIVVDELTAQCLQDGRPVIVRRWMQRARLAALEWNRSKFDNAKKGGSGEDK